MAPAESDVLGQTTTLEQVIQKALHETGRYGRSIFEDNPIT